MPNHRRPQKKSDAHLGFERMLNTPEASPLTNPVVFQNVMKASGVSLSQALKHIGKGTKIPQKTEKQKSEERLEILKPESEN